MTYSTVTHATRDLLITRQRMHKPRSQALPTKKGESLGTKLRMHSLALKTRTMQCNHAHLKSNGKGFRAHVEENDEVNVISA